MNVPHSSANSRTQPHRGARLSHGFTLIEMLVVIAIIALLSVMIVPAVTGALKRAETTKALSGLRQSGAALQAKITDRRGSHQILSSGNGAGLQKWRLYNIVLEFVGGSRSNDDFVRSIVTTPSWNEDAGSTWEVWASTRDNNPDNGVYWNHSYLVDHDNDGVRDREVSELKTARVKNPALFPLLADSANASGQPRARIENAGDYRFALRYDNRGFICTLDGSAKMIDIDQMEDYGFTSAYVFDKGNPKTDPTLITP